MTRELHRRLYLPPSIGLATAWLVDFAAEIPRLRLLSDLRQVQMIAVVLLLLIESTGLGVLPEAPVEALLRECPPGGINLIL